MPSAGIVAAAVSGRAARPVVDQTGLTGEYDFTLHWSWDPQPASPPEPNRGGQALIKALREQLGLELQPQKAPVNVYVIDRAERPTGN